MKAQHQHTARIRAPKGSVLRALAGFEVGAVAAIPVACFLPYEAFDSSLRLNLVASVCLGFVLFRVALRHKALPGTWGLLALAAGAGLMSAGGYMAPSLLTGPAVLAGTAAMLLGLSIVIQAPRPSSARPEEPARQQPVSDERSHSEDLAALALGVGMPDQVELPSTAVSHHPAKEETSWHQYTAQRGAPRSA